MALFIYVGYWRKSDVRFTLIKFFINMFVIFVAKLGFAKNLTKATRVLSFWN
jgi:hypothetical protein